MGQVTIYLDDETVKQARSAAQAKGVSLSKWVAEKSATRRSSDLAVFRA